MKSENVILEKSKIFAIKVIKLYKYLCDETKEYVLSTQLIKSGKSIGANVKEAIRGQSRADFVAKLNISLKEASETEYWLELLWKTGFITEMQFNDIQCECIELIKILTAIIKTSKGESNL
jgi:four helix bundle protein